MMNQVEFEELRKRVEMGEELQVYHDGKEYWISKNVDGYYFTRVEDSFSQDFKSVSDLFENATIDSNCLNIYWKKLSGD